jgi:hypothetical protein
MSGANISQKSFVPGTQKKKFHGTTEKFLNEIQEYVRYHFSEE